MVVLKRSVSSRALCPLVDKSALLPDFKESTPSHCLNNLISQIFLKRELIKCSTQQ